MTCAQVGQMNELAAMFGADIMLPSTPLGCCVYACMLQVAVCMHAWVKNRWLQSGYSVVNK